jgi:urease accessory protein
MTAPVTKLLGHRQDDRYARRRIVEVEIAWDEASRRRLRRTAADGTDVAIELGDGGYLADGAVLADDGVRVLVVKRPVEPVLVVRFDLQLSPSRLVEQALAVGHTFGNQHVPVDFVDGEARIPLTTSEAIARASVAALKLEGATLGLARATLGATRPLSIGHGHRHEHA